jgi:NAD(P)-dependent dehydrogenase (short-subunit alcohol dehydrogenase family)
MSSAAEIFAEGTAVVTGAGAGLGEGLARHAGRLGMRVVLADVAEDRLTQVAAELRADGVEVLTVRTDVGDPEEVEVLAKRAYDAFGSVQLLVNNAGVETTGYSWEIPPERWNLLMRVNLSGVYHGIRAFVPRMLRTGESSYVVNLSSVGGLAGAPLMAPYTASKAAVLALTESLAQEMQLIDAPIHVSAVLPGAVRTRIFNDAVASEAEPNDVAAWYRRMMRDNVAEHGIAPLDAAQEILEQVAEGSFWILTHPERAVAIADRRGASLRDRSAPRLAGPLSARRKGKAG